jgi:predicted CopG family antitoxin
MPPKGYSNITVREEVREELEKLRKEIGIRDFSDLLVLLVKSYREYTSISSKIEEILTSISSKIDILLTSTTSKPTSNTSNDTITRNSGTVTHNAGDNPPQQVSTPTAQQTAQQKKGDACSWLEEKKIIVESDIADRYDRNARDRLFKKWREACKAEVIEGSSERAAVDRQLWDELQKKINMVSSDSDELAKKTLSRDEYRLFRWLRNQGVLVFSNIEKRWKIVK